MWTPSDAEFQEQDGIVRPEFAYPHIVVARLMFARPAHAAASDLEIAILPDG